MVYRDAKFSGEDTRKVKNNNKIICLDIWMEQKIHPWRLAAKLLCIFLALFVGMLVPAFPFSFMLVMLCVFAFSGNRTTLNEEMQGARGLPEMSYMVPRSISEMKQYELHKNLLKAVFYACITILAYGITIGSTAELSFDGGMLLVLLLLFVYQLMMFYQYYLYCLIAIYQKREGKFALIKLEYLFAGIILAGLCCYQFTGYAVMGFLNNPLWWMGSVAVILLIFMIQSIQIKRCAKRLLIGDYRR